MEDFERDFEEFLVADTDPEPYLFEPEHTDEELHVFDAERVRQEAESSAPILLHRMGFGATIVGEIYHQEEKRCRECITRSEIASSFSRR
ncbi:hypothetical protein P7M35_24710 [Vibrio parahaemolyticus]|nr:hypothetical protein [Vibrio parahaemolyticus]